MQATSPVSTRAAGLNWSEIKSHSSLLTNERLGILLYQLDQSSMNANKFQFNITALEEYRVNIYQIWLNARSLVRYNWNVRNDLKLETKIEGVYTIDVAFEIVEKMNLYCFTKGCWTYNEYYVVMKHLNRIQSILRDVLQYFHYLFRPEFRQKPDIEVATEQYKEMADKLTIEQLKAVVGKNHKIDFENLGTVKMPEEEQELIEDKNDEE